MTSNRRSSLRFRKVRYLDTSGPSMARRSTRPWERRHLLSTDWGFLPVLTSKLLPAHSQQVGYRTVSSFCVFLIVPSTGLLEVVPCAPEPFICFVQFPFSCRRWHSPLPKPAKTTPRNLPHP